MRRLDDAAPALAHLGSTGEVGAMARSSLVADAAHRIKALETQDASAGDALGHMQACLARPE